MKDFRLIFMSWALETNKQTKKYRLIIFSQLTWTKKTSLIPACQLLWGHLRLHHWCESIFALHQDTCQEFHFKNYLNLIVTMSQFPLPFKNLSLYVALYLEGGQSQQNHNSQSISQLLASRGSRLLLLLQCCGTSPWDFITNIIWHRRYVQSSLYIASIFKHHSTYIKPTTQARGL